MSHVDDGMLHAYLDGALSALDAVRVERHVADCAACQQRLDAARVQVQRAARLLEWASPPADRAAPPLAELRPYSAPRWQVPVAWAATIVIALGVGAYGSQLLMRERSADGFNYASNEEVARSRDAQLDPRAAPITVTAADSPRAVAAAPAPAESERAAPAAPAPVVQAPAAGITTAVAPSRDSTAVNKLADATAKAPVDSAGAAALEARRLAEAPVAAAAPASQRESDSLREPAMAAQRQEGRSSFVARTFTAPATISVDSARALLGTAPLALPDYPVTGIRVRDGAVVVEHVLPPGRVIRLVQRRVAGANEQAAPTGDALARYADGLRVEISGPMAADSLSTLLGRARAMP